jgi:hypothetical protein
MGCAVFGPQSLKKIVIPSFVVTVFIKSPALLRVEFGTAVTAVT